MGSRIPAGKAQLSDPTTESYLSQLGGAVASGDVNGDGYDDVIVTNSGGTVGDRGRAYLILGGEFE